LYSSINTEETGSDQIIKIVKRRKKLLITIPLLVTLFSGCLIFILPKEYMSSATILAKKTQTLNPLISYQMAVQVANRNQLNSMNQIIYSRAALNMLIDSLELAEPGLDDEDKEALLKQVKKDVVVKLNKANIFTVEYTNENPDKAKKGVDLLLNYFIETDQRMSNEQNLETVDFFENETAHLKKMLEKTKTQRLKTIRKRVKSDPEESLILQSRLHSLHTDITNSNINLTHLQNQLALLDSLNSIIKEDNSQVLDLLKLDLKNIPYGSNLQSLLEDYTELRQTYTPNYPSVKTLNEQIISVANQIPSSLMNQINTAIKQKNKLEEQEKNIVSKIENYSVAKGEDKSQADYYGVYQDLYNKMNVKLEQAHINYQLGKNSKQRFVLLDPAIVPSKPSKPKGKLILVGGFMIGCFLGIMATAAAEMLDTTIYDSTDLVLYGKPIIAFIPEGKK
jgi:uncharacterized protein involved in exopolysaccharide biosynthesis